jgi:beta-glucanase (GH16 family)
MSRFPAAVIAGLITALAGVFPIAAPASAAPLVQLAPFACGFQNFKKADGSRYVCSFVDDFNGKVLNPANWSVQASSGPSGFVAGGTCYTNSPDNVFVRNGALNLVGRVASSPFECRTPYQTLTTSHTGGAVSSWDKFSQAYGRFSFRAKYPATREAGYYGNLWLYPQSLTYGRWPQSGEIDIAEQWSGYTDRVYPSLHYPGRTDADTAMNCTVRDVRNWHEYTLEWAPTEMKFFYDAKLCWTRSWTPTPPLVAPQPFDMPFTIVMSQGLSLDGYNTMTAKLPTSGAMQIDWVRVWS